jgi:hypothetical protein
MITRVLTFLGGPVSGMTLAKTQRHETSQMPGHRVVRKLFISQARHDSVWPSHCLEALLSLAGRLQSRRRMDLAFWLQSCKRKTSFSDTHKHKRSSPVYSQIQRSLVETLIEAARVKDKRIWFGLS